MSCYEEKVQILFTQAHLLEDERQYMKALNTYSFLIQTLLVEYERVDAITKKEMISIVHMILKRTEHIRYQLDWQEQVDEEKKKYLANERLYTEYFEAQDDKLNRILPLPTYEQSNTYPRTETGQLKQVSSCSSPLPPVSHVRLPLFPPDFSLLPQYPVPPMSYSYSRKFSVYGEKDQIHPSSIPNPNVISQYNNSELRRRSRKSGVSLEEITTQIRYMLSTGIRTCVLKLMTCEVWDPMQMHKQLDFQMFYFSDIKEKLYAQRDLASGRLSSLIFEAKYDFKFCEYGQFLFRELRWQNGIDCDYYVHSLCSDPDGASIVDMMAEGKSQANFFRSADGEFILKSLTEAEFDFFQQILLSYFEHQMANPHTFITRIYGLHQIQMDKEEPLYFIVMENIVPLASDIIRYDLKGSSVGRAAKEEEKEIGGVLKDQDFTNPFIFDANFQDSFFKQLATDCSWLESHDIMDYSLLLGVAHRPSFMVKSSKSDHRSPSIFKATNGGFRSTDEHGNPLDTLYYAGIIDILQAYTIKKKVEHAFKSIRDSSAEISCINPADYSKRFQDFFRANTTIALSLGTSSAESS